MREKKGANKDTVLDFLSLKRMEWYCEKEDCKGLNFT